MAASGVTKVRMDVRTDHTGFLLSANIFVRGSNEAFALVPLGGSRKAPTPFQKFRRPPPCTSRASSEHEVVIHHGALDYGARRERRAVLERRASSPEPPRLEQRAMGLLGQFHGGLVARWQRAKARLKSSRALELRKKVAKLVAAS